jgi:hypothetical protein
VKLVSMQQQQGAKSARRNKSNKRTAAKSATAATATKKPPAFLKTRKKVKMDVHATRGKKPRNAFAYLNNNTEIPAELDLDELAVAFAQSKRGSELHSAQACTYFNQHAQEQHQYHLYLYPLPDHNSLNWDSHQDSLDFGASFPLEAVQPGVESNELSLPQRQSLVARQSSPSPNPNEQCPYTVYESSCHANSNGHAALERSVSKGTDCTDRADDSL